MRLKKEVAENVVTCVCLKYSETTGFTWVVKEIVP